MRTGVTYMGQYDRRYIDLDLREMKELGLDDVFLAAQENDFMYFPGKLDYFPKIAEEYGIRPIAIFWGALNLFGGGRSSQFLLENPGCFQVALDGSHLPSGCYVNPSCQERIKEMVDSIVARGFSGYFIDEPTPLRDCYCGSCRGKYDEWYGGDLQCAPAADREEFRRRCVVEYVRGIAAYCRANHPDLATMCCLMPHDSGMWADVAALPGLDDIGSDIYWINDDRDVEEMAPIVREMDGVCRKAGKTHHQWLQCWDVRAGRERRVLEQGKVLLREKPDALYVWAWKGQAGTTEACADPVKAWGYAENVLREAKGL